MHSVGKHAFTVHYVKNMAHLSFQLILHIQHMPWSQKIVEHHERRVAENIDASHCSWYTIQIEV